ncbi:MAG: hypothetical protein DLM59_18010 [Pseudonocardiales bacterium]|nr:MAG: hypothetical protein DLM59_18010 [Pseudonocardiales bacterium]
MVPWCVLLAATLPAAAQAQNWSLAWVGLDGATAAAAFGTAHLLARTDGRAALAATAGATLLLVDSWFDVCTSGPGLARAFSIAEAVAVEVPLAVAGIWLALALTRGAR